MNQRTLLSLLLLCLTGCDPFSHPKLIMSSNGISYEIHLQKQIAPDPGILTNSADKTPHTGFTFIGEHITIKEFDGNLTVNGKDYGAVQSGDKVHVDDDGKVSITKGPGARVEFEGTPSTPK